MELREALTTTPATRTFTDEPVSDTEIFRLLDVARFAPNGGNRQGWHVLVIRDPATREAIASASAPTARRYVAQKAAGEQPLNTINPSRVDAATIETTELPAWTLEHYRAAPVLILVCVDLSVVASVDADLDRVGVISGASIYPFAWSFLLAAREAGLGGVLTTMPVGGEPELRKLLGIPSHVAIAAVIPLGRPATQVTKLRRGPVAEFARLERWDGPALSGSD
ncbi:MAG TPA: nitroreductase family protein [Sporichthyaceae bacterium]|jgi:nitroreductase|nr:nitroreductase family protein [Sporichthyaceae bacterium]